MSYQTHLDRVYYNNYPIIAAKETWYCVTHSIFVLKSAVKYISMIYKMNTHRIKIS